MPTLFIANRGECAIRIMRTARALGYRIAVVFADNDANSAHVKLADWARSVATSACHSPYLDGVALMDACRACGASAVHPGYGFLAESPEFAESVLANGLQWVGPSPDAMHSLGNKAQARKLAKSMGIPVLPGFDEDDGHDPGLIAAADQLGFPLMIKAASGGGGRGMRLVKDRLVLPELLQSARAEAFNACGDTALLLERAATRPRHIEIQVLADQYGHVVHLGERDCTVQRRHQKLIEEAPSPALDVALRRRMGAAAVSLVSSCAYAGVGTVEFLLEPDGQFWFIEVNTRLQVEHGVTEALMGIDLVAWQLRVASGERLPWTQDELDEMFVRGGHALEVRVCSEDASRNFMPETGLVAAWCAPEGVRVDHAIEAGLYVTGQYDSMLAKVIVHESDRDAARHKMWCALDQTLLLGLTTNIDYLQACMHNAEFAAGDFDTEFVKHHGVSSPDADLAFAQLVLFAVLARCHTRVTRASGLRSALRGWSSTGVSQQVYKVLMDDVVMRVLIDADSKDAPHALRVSCEGRQVVVDHIDVDAHQIRANLDGVHSVMSYAQQGRRWHCRSHQRTTWMALHDAAGAADKRYPAQDADLSAPLGARVMSVRVTEGEMVQAGQTLVVLDAMKMEHSLKAPRDGIASMVSVRVGQQVRRGDVLLRVDALVEQG